MRTPKFWILVLLAQPAMLALCSSLAAAEKPNVLVILTDDQGWGDSERPRQHEPRHAAHRFAGARRGAVRAVLRLPGLLADAGRVSHRPLSPARRRPGRSTGGERLNLDERTIADAFQAAGYATGAVRQVAQRQQYPYHPNARGFDEFYGFCSGHWGDYFSPPLEHNGEIVRGNGFIADDFTDTAHRRSSSSTATGRSSAICRSTRRTRRCRCRTGAGTNSKTRN